MPFRPANNVLRTLCAAALASAALPASAAAPERPSGKVEAEYLITWMGITVYSARLAADWEGDRYRVQFRAEAEGLVRLAANTVIAWETRGRFAKGRLLPETFEQANTFRKQTRRITIAYAASAKADALPKVSVVPPESPGKRPAVPEPMKADTLDPLTAALDAVAMPLSRPSCGYAAKIFEGLRRTDIRLDHQGAERTPVRGAGLERDSLVCLLHAKRLAGYEEKHFRQHPDPLPPATLWVARHPEAALWLPVQLRFESSYGPIYARLVRLETKMGAGK